MKHYLLYSKLISKNKAFETQISGSWSISPEVYLKIELVSDTSWFSVRLCLFNVIDISIGWSRKRDHAGFCLELKFIYLFLLLNLYDTRHWNDEADRFYFDNEIEY